MHANLAGQYFARGDLDRAAQEYDAALRIRPDSPDTQAFYAALEYRRANYQHAGVLMETALSRSGRNNLNYDFMVVTFAAILMKTNHLDGARDYLNREIQEAPSYAPAWSLRAALNEQLKNSTAARSDAETALQLNPGDEQAQAILRELSTAAPATLPH